MGAARSPSSGFRAAQPDDVLDRRSGWRMVNPAMPEQWTISLGESAEKLAEIHGISRDAQDAFALRSHRLRRRGLGRAASTTTRSCRSPDTSSTRDEGIRPDTTLEKLGELKPAFATDGTVTAGNSSPLNDGAARAAARRRGGGAAIGREPLARIAGARRCRRRPRRVRDRARSRPRTARSRGPASAGPTSTSSSSTRRSPSQSLACLQRLAGARPGEGQHQRRRDRDRPPARRVRRAHPRPRSRTSCAGAAAATASPRSASASARASPSCWRP